MKKYIILFFLASLFEIVTGQDLPKIGLQSPDAAALSKYSEFPIGGYSGIPDISLPLYTVEVGDIKFPIALNYHAGGFRLSEEASWVGLGWILSTNAMLTQEVHGGNDYTGSGILYTSEPYIIDPDGYNGFGGSERIGGYSEIRPPSNALKVDGTILDYSAYAGAYEPLLFDWEPDIYSINFMGHSGKFVIDQHYNVHFLEKQDIDIRKTDNGWLARTNDGFQYYFETYNKVNSSDDQSEISRSWYLTKIISPLNRTVTLNYIDGNIIYMNSYNETALKSMSSNTSTYDIVNPLHGSQYSEKYLQSIIFDDGSHVIFDRLSELRKDLKNAESLHSISIYNSTSSQPIRTFVFNTDYFTSDALASEGFMKTLSDDEYTFYRKRLKLISVTEENGSDISKYQFEYSNINLPPKDSYNQDHWGFYNGASNTMLLPSFQGTLEYQELYNKQILSGFPGLGSNQILILQSERKYAEYTGANRESNKDYMPACILKKIIYPTGGSTEFEFEANEYSNINDSRDDNYTYTDFTASYEVLCSTTGSPIITKTFNYPYTFSSDVMDIVNPVVNMVIMPWNVTNYNECSPSFLPSGDYFEINLGARDYYGTSFTYHKTFPFDDPDQNPSTANPDNCLRSYTFSLDGQNTYTGPLNMNISIANTLEGKRAILNFSGKLKKYVTTGTYQKKTGGGLRVKKIKHSDGYDSSKDIIKKYSYGYDTTLSNGTIENITYGILKTHVRNYSVKLNYPDNNTSAWSDIRFTSSNIHSMSYSQNNLIGYSKITEYLGENGESGSTEYDYNNFPDFLFDQKTRPPGVPNSTKILYDGKLLTKTMYDNNNHKVYLEHNNYTLLDEHIIRGMFQDRFRFVSGAGEGFLQVGNGCLHYYPVFARWEALDNKTERTFNPSTGQYLETLISYTYNSTNLLPKTVFTYSSKGDNLITKNFYPTDVTTVNSLPGGALSTNELNYINQLKGIYNNNIVSFKTGEIIQKEEWKQDVLLTRQRTNYNLFNNIILPETVEFATADNPLENRLIYSNYDSKGNLLEVSKSDDVKVTYIWGYNQSYPVVKIEGKSYNDIQSIRTIIEGHPFSGKTDFTSIKADRDFLNTQLLSLLIDPACMVTYYTYAPLIGMTSQSDPNGVTTYFEYDFFGRLKLVRDNDGNILKTYDYHYKE